MTAAETPAGSGEEHPGTRVSDDRILSIYTLRSQDPLPGQCEDLLNNQRLSWPQLIDGYAAFKDVICREVMCEGYSVVLQFNPGRIISSGANTNPRSIRDRKCFLCVENLPPQQKGVLYHDRFLVLCNPAPILNKHLTISHVDHTPQAMEGSVRTFLDLAREMSPSFTVFYNGPQCGASAPDHLHFQASPTGTIPVERDAADSERRELMRSISSTSIHTLKNMGRRVLVIEGDEVSGVEDALTRLFLSLRRTLPTEDEPMVNVLCSYQGGRWRLIVFPRRGHRPHFYFNTGDARVLISPAAIDMGGLVVTPIEKDYRRVDATMIQTIFDEVALDGATVDRVIAAM